MAYWLQNSSARIECTRSYDPMMLVEKVIVVADIAGGGVKTENSFGSNLPIPHRMLGLHTMADNRAKKSQLCWKLRHTRCSSHFYWGLRTIVLIILCLACSLL